jgi:hypothetical protein
MSLRTTTLPIPALAGKLAILAGCAAALLLSTASGCSELDLRKGMPWIDSDPEPQNPTRIVDVWTDTVLWQPGKPGVRGFGGRVMFHRGEDEEPVAVDGTLTVYAFDDEDPDPDKPPAKKYIFPADQLSKHYSKSKVGHSYSFWLPWGDVLGPEQQLSLIARFEDREGKVVMSKVAHKTLPGRNPKRNTAEVMDAGAVRQVAHQAPVQTPAGDGERRQMSTLTIDVTPSFAQQLRAAANLPAETLPDSTVTAGSRAAPTAGSREGLGESTSGASGSADSRRSRFPAPGGAEAGRAYGLFPRPLRRARWPSPLPGTPRSSRFPPAPETTAAGGSTPY